MEIEATTMQRNRSGHTAWVCPIDFDGRGEMSSFVTQDCCGPLERNIINYGKKFAEGRVSSSGSVY